MPVIHPQYITDTAGRKMVVLPAEEFNSIMEKLEEMEDIRLYDETEKNDTGERIHLEKAFKMIEARLLILFLLYQFSLPNPLA